MRGGELRRLVATPLGRGTNAGPACFGLPARVQTHTAALAHFLKSEEHPGPRGMLIRLAARAGRNHCERRTLHPILATHTAGAIFQTPHGLTPGENCECPSPPTSLRRGVDRSMRSPFGL